MRPSGLGLRLISSHVHPHLDVDGKGERWPFDTPFASFPFPFRCPFPFDTIEGSIDLSANGSSFSFFPLGLVRLVTFRTCTGVLLFDLALLRSGLVTSSSSISSSMTACFAISFFLADLVTGPKYPSCDCSAISEEMGEAEMTFGVPGTGFEDVRDILKGGRGGIWIVPTGRRPRIGGKSQWWRFK